MSQLLSPEQLPFTCHLPAEQTSCPFCAWPAQAYAPLVGQGSPSVPIAVPSPTLGAPAEPSFVLASIEPSLSPPFVAPPAVAEYPPAEPSSIEPPLFVVLPVPEVALPPAPPMVRLAPASFEPPVAASRPAPPST